MGIDRYRFGINLKMILRKKGIKQKDLAKAMNKNEVYISRWANGARIPATRTILEIAYLTDVTLDELMEGVLIP